MKMRLAPCFFNSATALSISGTVSSYALSKLRYLEYGISGVVTAKPFFFSASARPETFPGVPSFPCSRTTPTVASAAMDVDRATHKSIETAYVSLRKLTAIPHPPACRIVKHRTGAHKRLHIVSLLAQYPQHISELKYSVYQNPGRTRLGESLLAGNLVKA